MSRYFQWQPYVPVAERRANAARQAAKMAKKGNPASPVVLKGKSIATTFWGKAWCDNLEAYSDFENRLPRGRTYIRNGSVIDLKIAEGKVTALVCGSSLYRITIKIQPLAKQAWETIKKECAGKIDSLIELLQGRLSAGVMQIVTRQNSGLFPNPKQIDLDCSCPDWADMCKHIAAALYGVGTRLDEQPNLLFLLRGVNPEELISAMSAMDATQQTSATSSVVAGLSDAELGDVFGIELAGPPKAAADDSNPLAKPPKTKAVKATKQVVIKAAKKNSASLKPIKKRPSARKLLKKVSPIAW